MNANATETEVVGGITWDTDCDAPGCPGMIVNDRTGATKLVDTDWEYPGTATTFGWSLKNVQQCPECDHIENLEDDEAALVVCTECEYISERCAHDATYGTVGCKDCKLTASDFITAAGEWLENNDGVKAEDPGYFQ